jgi:hypothetical protein
MALAAELPQSLLVAQQVLPRDLETQLAESALPPRLRADATVYVLNLATGFEVVREGNNGFHAFVARQDWAAFFGAWDYTEHPDDVIVPIAFDAAGQRQPMRAIFDAHQLQMRGSTAQEVKQTIRQRFLVGEYKPHERAGVAYMLSPIIRAYRDPMNGPERVTASIPHRMFYAPNIDNEDIGGAPFHAGQFDDNPFVIQPGPHGYMIILASPAEMSTILPTRVIRQRAGSADIPRIRFCLWANLRNRGPTPRERSPMNASRVASAS